MPIYYHIRRTMPTPSLVHTFGRRTIPAASSAHKPHRTPSPRWPSADEKSTPHWHTFPAFSSGVGAGFSTLRLFFGFCGDMRFNSARYLRLTRSRACAGVMHNRAAPALMPNSCNAFIVSSGVGILLQNRRCLGYSRLVHVLSQMSQGTSARCASW